MPLMEMTRIRMMALLLLLLRWRRVGRRLEGRKSTSQRLTVLLLVRGRRGGGLARKPVPRRLIHP